jgi:hypothetical protein
MPESEKYPASSLEKQVCLLKKLGFLTGRRDEMFSLDDYNSLVPKYGSFASWAIWDSKDESDPSTISEHIDQLHSRFVLLGLNASQSLAEKPWSNFHTGPHNIRKIKFACNDTGLRGSYMTDLFKGIIELKSEKLMKQLPKAIITENVSLFNREMADVGVSNATQFIVFGTPTSVLAKCFNDYFKQKYTNTVIYHYHYSYYAITDREWVCRLWKKLGINNNYDLIRKKYY